MCLQWRAELEEILEVAQMDSEQWVSMLAELMKTYPSTGNLNLEIGEVEENRRIFTDLITDLRKLGASYAKFYLQPKINADVFPAVKKQTDSGMLPLECHYLNKAVLNAYIGNLVRPTSQLHQHLHTVQK